MQKSPIGVPIHTNVGFQVAKVAVGGPLWVKRPRGRPAANGFVHGSKNERERCCVIEVRIDAELMHFI